MPRSIPFAPKHLPHHFGGICEDWVQPVFQNHDFRFSAHTPPSHKIKPKHQNHWTCLCTNHAKINSFSSQTSPPSLWRNLWGLSPASFPKPWFSFFTPNTTKSLNQAKTPKSWNWLCTNHAKINSFSSQTSPTSLWRHLWGLSPTSFPKPWFSFFTQHSTKSQNQAKTPKSWNLWWKRPKHKPTCKPTKG